VFAYMAELSRRRRDLRESLGVSPLLFTVEADKRVRSMVARFTMEDREVYTDYETALRSVLESHAYLWSDARETIAAGQRQRATTPPRDCTKKSKLDDKEEDKEDKQPKKKKSRVQRLRERLDLLQQGSGKSKQDSPQGRQHDRDRRGQGQDRQADRSSKGGGKGTTDGRKLAPEKLWAKVNELARRAKGVCKFYNCPGDCKFGRSCNEKHQCIECGGDHPYFEKHRW